SPVDVSCSVTGIGAGQWVNVTPVTNDPLSALLTGITPPGPAGLLLNTSPAEQLTAQVNGFVVATLTHNYFKSHAPSFTGIDLHIPCQTGVNGSCNAYYTANTINFYHAANGCVNSAYSTVISHEYGHFIVAHLGAGGNGLPQNAFGEGYGDVN